MKTIKKFFPISKEKLKKNKKVLIELLEKNITIYEFMDVFYLLKNKAEKAYIANSRLTEAIFASRIMCKYDVKDLKVEDLWISPIYPIYPIYQLFNK